MDDTALKITVLGATGSIGGSTADLILRHRQHISAYALVGHRNYQRMQELAELLRPELVVMTDAKAAKALRGKLPAGTILDTGMDAAIAAASANEVDMVMAAMVGSVGLPAALAAVKAGKRVGLANKECLVTAGRLFMETARKSAAVVVPVDSEHAAVDQCLTGHDRSSIRRVILTASGGPFRNRDPKTLDQVTPAEAIAHPNWEMGAKISVDSATMMNKALELIEARWLFNLPPESLSAIIHPQSIVHAMVEYRDGSVVAQLAEPDMRGPIAYAIQATPRLESGIPFLDLTKHGQLEFQPIDEQRFPAMGLVKAVMHGKDSFAIVFNAANEVANAAFRAGRLRFTAIVQVVEHVLTKVDQIDVSTIEDVLYWDGYGRQQAEIKINQESNN
ncbi:MAG: 1-deoxy-D-xylulose-5-phosphate reductoisomerase [Mariprofundaceae bacterium]